MRTSLFLASFLVLTDLSGVAHADMRSAASGPPTFTAADAGIIARNEVLAAIVEKDPWLVRRVLDLAAAAPPAGRAATGQSEQRPNAGASDDEPMRRDALGSVEWIKLLKRAKQEKDAKGQSSGAVADPRSAIESVRWIELVKAAKAAKAAEAAEQGAGRVTP